MDPVTNVLVNNSLHELNTDIPLSHKLKFLHGIIRQRCAYIDRIAVALHDPKSDFLKTFLYSSDDVSPLVHYQARLAEVTSLLQVAESGKPRVINDLATYTDHRTEHARKLRDFASSYTLPVYAKGRFFGFVFFNSYTKGVFLPECLPHLDLFGHMIGLTVISEILRAETLTAAIKTTTDIAQHRDPETGNHLERMARYVRIIATDLADAYGLSDEFIEHLFLFAPLHDIGKVGIPDSILLKKGALTSDEFEVMKSHAAKGRAIIDALLENFHLGSVDYSRMLRNIAELHHEKVDGCGYPYGLRGSAIPIEARIVAVADVFDALTSERPYKGAWDNDRAFATLTEVAGTQLDRDCVDALTRRRAEVEEVQRLFREDVYG